MRSIIKVIAVLVAFSALFFGLRVYGIYVGYDVAALVSDVGGLAYLYSTVGTIFAIFAAFVIVSESQDWNTLNGATKNEVRDMSELLSWSKRLSPSLAEKIASHMFTSFDEFLNHRATRIEYIWRPLPVILKFTVFLVDSAVIGLSLFIGVRNMWLDYLFMLCIVTLGSVILLVVDDLDNPLRPGDWWLTSESHHRLLKRLG
jgi:hypothetical protein